jgi:hypothetical protein
MLVGAVALAFVILGLTAVYTAQLSARPASTGTAGVDAGNAEEFNRESRRQVRVLAVRANHAEPYYASETAVNDSVDDAVGNYSALVSETYAGRSGTVVAVTYTGVAADGYGTRTVTRGNETSFEDPANPGTDWAPVDRRADVGWFVLSFNVTAMPEGQPFRVVVENGTAADLNPDTGPNERRTVYTFTRNSTGESVLTIDVDLPGTPAEVSTTCNPTGQRSLVDLKSASVPTSGCSFVPGIAQLDGPYTVRFENPDNAVGGFSVVTDVDPLATWDAGVTDPNSLPACDDPAAGPGDPCNTYAVWNATVTTEYYTDRLSYSNTQNVTVYEGA